MYSWNVLRPFQSERKHIKFTFFQGPEFIFESSTCRPYPLLTLVSGHLKSFGPLFWENNLLFSFFFFLFFKSLRIFRFHFLTLWFLGVSGHLKSIGPPSFFVLLKNLEKFLTFFFVFF